MKVVAINGSPRANGNTQILLEAVMEEIQKGGVETQMVHIGGLLWRGCSGCGKCGEVTEPNCVYVDDIFNECFHYVLQAQGLLLGSPVYTSDVTTSMKAFLERAATVRRLHGNLFKYKVAAGIVAARRAGFLHAFDTLNHFFLNGHMIVPGSSYWNLGVGCNVGEVKQDEEGMSSLHHLGRNFRYVLSKLHMDKD